MPSFETTMLIGGRRIEGQGVPLEVENPFTEETIATVGTADEGQLDAAIGAAREASRAWMRTPAVERGELLHEVAERIRARTDELAEAMTLEGGKPLVENSDEVSWVAACFRYYAEIGRDSAGRVIPSIESSQLAMVLKEPHGVWGCIVPWNYPLLLLAWKLAPALAAGNATVCKPSELTPLSTLMLADCLDPLPPGVLNLVAGGGDVGAAITADPRIDGVAFTGSVETGKKVGHACVDRVARVNLVIGDPMQPDTDIGPMVSASQRSKVAGQVEAAVSSGAELLVGGDSGGNDSGHFYSPAVVTGAAAETSLLSEETFGPVAPLVRVKSLDEAIELANSTPYGLGANIYTQDFKTILRCMREVKAGTVWFNDPLTDNDAGPVGGVKQSGLGRELGREGLEAFQETKHVHIETELAPKEWWYPYSE